MKGTEESLGSQKFTALVNFPALIVMFSPGLSGYN